MRLCRSQARDLFWGTAEWHDSAFCVLWGSPPRLDVCTSFLNRILLKHLIGYTAHAIFPLWFLLWVCRCRTPRQCSIHHASCMFSDHFELTMNETKSIENENIASQNIGFETTFALSLFLLHKMVQNMSTKMTSWHKIQYLSKNSFTKAYKKPYHLSGSAASHHTMCHLSCIFHGCVSVRSSTKSISSSVRTLWDVLMRLCRSQARDLFEGQQSGTIHHSASSEDRPRGSMFALIHESNSQQYLIGYTAHAIFPWGCCCECVDVGSPDSAASIMQSCMIQWPLNWQWNETKIYWKWNIVLTKHWIRRQRSRFRCFASQNGTKYVNKNDFLTQNSVLVKKLIHKGI